ncbi:MAG: restriction endonuclease subunit S, partial [Gammaproteobacteria bacterium]|nr:restriction endonuclease subunit S [Gammaproteobacteria bacterium]
MPQVVSGIYGAIIQHIEPKHVQDLLVPEIPHEVKIKSHRLVNNAANLITEFLKELETATTEFFKSVGLSDISAFIWHGLERDFDFFHPFPNQESFRALNFNSRFKSLVKNLKTVSWHPLGKVCLPGTLKRCGRYKRVNAKPPDAYSLIGQKQLFTLRPRGRWIAKSPAGKELLVGPGTVLVAAQGTLGESELYCRSAFIWGKQLENAYSEHLLRVIADENIMLSGCLFAFMRSESVFRMLRSISTG